MKRTAWIVAALLTCGFSGAGRAEDALVSYQSLSPDVALDLAKAALDACRAKGFQVAVAVVDRSGQQQVMLRDRFAGAHTPTTAAGKAWTAASFRTNTGDPRRRRKPCMTICPASVPVIVEL